MAHSIDRAGEWRSPLLAVVSGLLLFEIFSGLSVYLLPFSVANQFMVLTHTALGLLMVLPYAAYQWRHWQLYRPAIMSHLKLSGYLFFGALAACVVSGLVLAYQSAFGRKIGYFWDRVHLITTFAVLGFLVAHVVPLWNRTRKGRVFAASLYRASGAWALGSGAVMGLGFVAVLACVWFHEPLGLRNEFPPDYSFKFGPNKPFVPSLARTDTGGAFDPRSLSDSASCGTSRCHDQIYREWQTSAHRYAAMDTAFQVIQGVMGKQNGPESTRYCGGCHDPISLFSGTKNIFVTNLTDLKGYQEGVSCLVCHSIRETDLKGNANYVITQPRRYAFEMEAGKAAKFLSDFLIRSYPKQHVDSLSKKLFKAPEYCAACHKQFVDQEVNQVGWVQLQNQYDNWRNSKWNTPKDARKTIECRECHMSLVESADPGAGDALDYNRAPGDGKHRSHRFIAANQWMASLLKLEGWQEQVRLTEQWLRGEFPIPEIAHKWSQGPAVPIEVVAPESTSPGQEVRLQVVITSNKVGHDFPTGPLDIIQSWVEMTVRDERGARVFESGTVDSQHFIQPGSFIFKAEPVDQYGNLIDRHNLWEMVGVRYRRSLFPGFSDTAEYLFPCPSVTVSSPPPAAGEGNQTASPGAVVQRSGYQFQAPPSGKLYIQAKLRYRKIDQYLLNYTLGKDSGLTAPITDISQDTAVIQVRP